MNILVLGGTRYFGVHLVNYLLQMGHDVTIATRGNTKDIFEDRVKRIIVDRTDEKVMEKSFFGKEYDIVCDNIAYCSTDVRNILSNVKCKRYVMTSTMSVYEKLTMDLKEEEMDATKKKLIWCDRKDYGYDVIKQQAEAALFQIYQNVDSAAVRFPFVIGKDDYTKRLYFYVEHVVRQKPMYVDNMDSKIAFIDSKEAGKFIAWLALQKGNGAWNACSEGVISIGEIIAYVEEKAKKKALLTADGEAAPYNGAPSYELNTDKAKKSGYSFTKLNSFLYALLDHYIQEAENK
ncbi:MAG: NAD-dependent epimerase/dehydratase family protein [Lachnospiraceae bacterium]|nr:NAD-dependent epimerase/dehydratase family protein [Lachnospiraceae bacterium]